MLRLSSGFAYHLRSSSEEKSGEKKTLTCLSPTVTHRDVEPGMDLAYGVVLRVVILQLSLLN